MYHRFRTAVLTGCQIAYSGLFLSFTRFGVELEESLGLSALFRMRGARPAPQLVTTVTLDQESAENLGLPPNSLGWPRRLHAGIIEKLVVQRASVIVFDVVFSGPTSEEDDAVYGLAPIPLPRVPIRVSQCRTFKTTAGCRPPLPLLPFQLFGEESWIAKEMIERVRPGSVAGSRGTAKLLERFIEAFSIVLQAPISFLLQLGFIMGNFYGECRRGESF